MKNSGHFFLFLDFFGKENIYPGAFCYKYRNHELQEKGS